MGLTGAGIEIVMRRAIEMVYEEMGGVNRGGLAPQVESRHLLAAIRDYKPNHNRQEYELQSLLAIRASNFYSVIPTLPRTGVYGRVQRPDGQLDLEQLDVEIDNLRMNRARAGRG